MDTAIVLEADIDGVPVDDPEMTRVQSPLFSFTLPEDNILGIPDPMPNPSPAVADGYWILLTPPSVGRHVIHFRGVLDIPEIPFTFETEVT